jgi:preprotein translocase subunit SecD
MLSTVKRGGIRFLVLLMMIAVLSGCSGKANSLRPDENSDQSNSLDQPGSTHVVLQAKPYENGREITIEDMEKARTIIEKRLNNLGVADSTVQADISGKCLIVKMAGVTEPEKIAEILTITGRLTFRNMDGEVLIDGSYLTDVRPDVINSGTDFVDYVIIITFNPEGAMLFNDITMQYLNQQIDIYLDEEMVTSPTVMVPIWNGICSISGYTSREETAEIAALLRSGSLPVGLDIVELKVLQ